MPFVKTGVLADPPRHCIMNRHEVMTDQVIAEDTAATNTAPRSRKEYGSEAKISAPAAKPRSAHEYHNGVSNDVSGKNTSPPYPVIHGDPVTISQCTFQAHMAR